MIDNVLTFDMKTGLVLTSFAAKTASYALGYNDDAGNIVAETTRENITANQCRPWKHGIAFVSNGSDSRVLCAGPIIDRKYDPATGKVSISGTGPWTLLQKTLLWEDSIMGRAENGVHMEAKNDAEHANSAWILNYTGTVSDNIWAMTKDLHPLLTMHRNYTGGSQHVRNYNILDYKYIGDLTKNLLELEDAPFLYFTPTLNNNQQNKITFDGYFQYKNECPTRTLNTGESVYNVKDWFVEEDAGNTRNRSFFKSSRNGQETDLYARADNTALQDDIGYFIDTADTSHNDISIPATIKDYATLSAHSSNALTMRIECAPRVEITDWKPSDTLRLRVSDSFYDVDYFEGTIKTIASNTSGKFTLDIVNVKAGQQSDNTILPVQKRSTIERVKALEANKRANV